MYDTTSSLYLYVLFCLNGAVARFDIQFVDARMFIAVLVVFFCFGFKSAQVKRRRQN